GGVASALVEQAERGIALRTRQVMGADVRHRDPDRIGNAARAIIADRAVFEELLIRRERRQNRLRQPLKGAPGQGTAREQARRRGHWAPRSCAARRDKDRSLAARRRRNRTTRK